MTSIVYLAAPYWDENPAVRGERVEAATRAAAHLVKKGMIVFSPLTHSHPIDLLLRAAEIDFPNECWLRFDKAFMEFCAEMVILTLDGWQKSNGIMREIEFFKERGRPITHLSVAEIE